MITSFELAYFISTPINPTDCPTNGDFSLIGIAEDMRGNNYFHNFIITSGITVGREVFCISVTTKFDVKTDNGVPDYDVMGSRTQLVDMIQIALAHARAFMFKTASDARVSVGMLEFTHNKDLWEYLNNKDYKLW